MGIRISRKGVFFTFISLSIVAMLLIITSTSRYKEVESDISIVNARIISLNNYVNDIENLYLERSLYATSYKAFVSIALYSNNTGKPLDNLAQIQEIIINGTINGDNVDIMQDNTLINWTDKISQISKDALKADTKFNINYINFTQSQPWYVDITLNLSYSVNSTFAYWARDNITIKTRVEIENFYDPYVAVNTKELRKIRISDVRYDEWNLTLLKEHIANQTYTHFEGGSAPSFLMRILNDTKNSSCCGIEYLINLSITVQESYVDYQFWNHTYSKKCNETFNITGMPNPGFKLDMEHLNYYRINSTNGEAVRTC